MGTFDGVSPLAGCAVTDEIHTENGKKGFSILCTTEAKCFKQAGEKCPSGYTVLRNNHDDLMVIECK